MSINLVDATKTLMCDIDTVRHYSAIRRKDVQRHGVTWRNIEHIMLSETSQRQKATYCAISLPA